MLLCQNGLTTDLQRYYNGLTAYEENLQSMMLNLVNYISFADSDFNKDIRNNNSLAGKTFVITGDVHIFKNRNELKSKIESLGGKVTGSVSKNTDFLINNNVESSSSKNIKAKELNVPIINEEDFINMIGGDNK